MYKHSAVLLGQVALLDVAAAEEVDEAVHPEVRRKKTEQLPITHCGYAQGPSSVFSASGALVQPHERLQLFAYLSATQPLQSICRLGELDQMFETISVSLSRFTARLMALDALPDFVYLIGFSKLRPITAQH